MKNIIKLLVLGVMTVGALVGCDDKSSKSVSQDSSLSPLSSISSSSSAPQASDSYHSLTSSITSSIISSVAPTIIGIALNTDNAKTDYKYGETFDTTGLVINAVYSDNTNLPINNYSIDLAHGTALTEHGTKRVTITYETFTADYTITINAIVTDLGFGGSCKTRYAPGEQLDLTGLTVAAVYSDGSVEFDPKYTSDPADGTVLTEVGAHRVNITYKGLTKWFLISVRVPRELRLNTENVKLTYEQGDVLDTTGLAVVANYTDNSNEDVTEFTTNPANGTVLNEIGTFDVTVSALNLTATYQIVVNKATKKNWTTEEAKIMSDNLHSVVLPFTGKEESVVGYDQEAKVVVIKGGEFTADELAAYGNAYISDGYKKVNSSAHVYEKSVETADGIRFVRASFTLDNKSLYLEAYDPYYYEFPTFFAEELASLGFGSTIVPPSFDADYYEISERNAAIYAYTNTDGTSTYTAALTTANWNVLEGVDANGFKTAISPDGLYAVKYI